MPIKILGIDLGTNSIGWGLVNRFTNYYALDKAGSLIFQEGVARKNGEEKPAVQDRTEARAARRRYKRIRLRKIAVLKILRDNGFCPYISDKSFDDWRYKKQYPLEEEFLNWQRTDDKINKNPYFDRNEVLSRKLDLTEQKERYLLGRAIYHLTQRRGFLSNRNIETQETDGVVKKNISELSKEMEAANCQYLGQYFYALYRQGSKIRLMYTDRKEHIEAEFYGICEKQNFPKDLKDSLYNAIFHIRHNSNNRSVGKCTFEPSKKCCPISHPAFEEYRMLAFINNIRIKGPNDIEYRPLSASERESIIHLFYRKSKPYFDFKDIAKKIAGKSSYSYRDDKTETAYKFNYPMQYSVSGNPVTANLIDIFGNDWENCICSCYTANEGKSKRDIINDVWHALYNFDSPTKLAQWAKSHLQLSENDADNFSMIKVPKAHASLSLKAINKILPQLRKGVRLDNAIFIANIDEVLPTDINTDIEEKSRIEDTILETLENFDEYRPSITKEQAVKQILEDIKDVNFDHFDRLYHPSKIKIYPDSQINENGRLLLGSPKTSAIRNPMVMRALYELRHLINRLLLDGDIDRTTRIHIEFARGINDANRRKAIELYNHNLEKKHETYRKILSEYYKTHGISDAPSDDDILKYELWEEQNHICLYTGEKIELDTIFCANPLVDIEHTIPRSVGGDDSKANKTLCFKAFNRQIKKTKLPAQLTEEDYNKTLQNIESLGWNKKIDDLRRQIAKIRPSTATTKEAKDEQIKKRHCLNLQQEYWRDKVRRFTMTEVPKDFSKRQGVDIGIIGKYAKEYLRSVFNSEEHQISIVKGLATAEFRKMWNLQDKNAAKDRTTHAHHAIDAIVIACIGHREYQQLAEYYRHVDEYKYNGGKKPTFKKPWPTFTEDVKEYLKSMFVVHHSQNNLLKQTKRNVTIKIKRPAPSATDDKKYIIERKIVKQKSDTAHAKLHKESFYGAIEHDGEIKHVIRKSLNDEKFSEMHVKNIVDTVVQKKIEDAIKERGFKHLLDKPIWMNEEKGIEIKKVRIFASKTISPMPLKKKHRDLSEKTYKQAFLVQNDSNYGMAIYEGHDAKGKIKRGFEIKNNLEAVQNLKTKTDIFPLTKDGLQLKWTLRQGMMVLLYEDTPNEVFNASKQELSNRLYEITGLANEGKGKCSITLKYHKEARTKLDRKRGKWMQNEKLRPIICMSHIQFNALIEGKDFILTESGTIKFVHNK